MTKHMDRILRDAVAAGLLAPDAAQAPRDERHWAILAMTAIGAWLSAIPLVAVVLLSGFSLLEKSAGMVLGIPLLIGCVLLLRSPHTSFFLEQMAVPGLLVGSGLLAFQVGTATRSAAMPLAVLVPVACIVAVAVRQAWVRTLAGVAIATLTAFALMAARDPWESGPQAWPWLVPLVAWLVLVAWQRALVLDGETAPSAAAIESVASGMAAATLAGMMWSSGRTFIVSEMLGDLSWAGSGAARIDALDSTVSVAAALAGAAWLAQRWPALRTRWCAVAAGPCAFVSWFSPLLGPALLMLSVCAGTGRHGMARFAGLAAAWMAGGLYYALAWTLATKALLMLGVGIAMMLLARYALAAPVPSTEAQPAPQPEPQARPAPGPRRSRLGFAACGLAALLLVNVGIWRNETLIGTGKVVYVELAPVDPRSLMQGDYMRLRFALPAAGPDMPGPGVSRAPAQVVARVDARGVATLERFHAGGSLKPGEFLVNVVVKDHDWNLATDAWYFKEGEAARWSKARYGEFRIDRDGDALLVGLRGPNLEKL